jgi:hypothetical protein
MQDRRSSLSRRGMSTIQEQQAVFFWMGLIGIVATGCILGIGGDNYWAVANVGNLDPSVESVKGRALMAALGVVVGWCDLVAFGVIFAGGVIVVQRLRGRA